MMSITIGKFKLAFFSSKIFLLLSLAALVFMWGAWYFFSSMTTVERDINITKLRAADKVYSYSIFSDYYFRLQSFDGGGNLAAEYSEFIPTRVNIGYQFDKDKPEIVVRAEDSGKPMVVNDITNNKQWDSAEIEFIKRLQGFSRKYGEIMAIQDQYYLDEARLSVMDIQKALYNSTMDLPEKNVSEFHESPPALAVDNLYLNIAKLDNISKTLKKFEACTLYPWCPDIIKWEFNQDDQIYLNYLGKYQSQTMDEFLDKRIQDKTIKNEILVRSVKATKESIQKFFFAIHLSENKARSYFMDENGYAYVLVLSTKNRASLFENLSEFLKISYGINFMKVKSFNNKFAEEQGKALIIGAKINDQALSLKKVFDETFSGLAPLSSSYLDSISSKDNKAINVVAGLYANKINQEQLTSIKTDVSKDDKNGNSDRKLAFPGLMGFYKVYGEYPNDDLKKKFDKLEMDLNDYRQELEKAKKYISNTNWLSVVGGIAWGGAPAVVKLIYDEDWKKILLEKCNDLKCIREENGWEWKSNG